MKSVGGEVMKKKLCNCKNRIVAFNLSVILLLSVCLQPGIIKVYATENKEIQNGTSDETNK